MGFCTGLSFFSGLLPLLNCGSSRDLLYICPTSKSFVISSLAKVDFDGISRNCQISVVSKVKPWNIRAVGKLETIGSRLERPYHRSYDAFMVREAVLDEEFWAAAWLRAESYTEEQSYLRYIDSCKRKFAEQEFTALKQRCFGRHGQSIKCICLVAIMTEESQDGIGNNVRRTLRDTVVGTLDISLRQLLRHENFLKEVVKDTLAVGLEQSHRCGYIANVCVARLARRKGIASSLLEVAIEAARNWSIKKVFVHVNTGNNAAQQLYMKFGFQVVEEATSCSSLEQKLLLAMSV